MVMVGEGGGMWALDRGNGQFLWATPFPYDVKNFIISNIDVKTGIAHLNTDLMFQGARAEPRAVLLEHAQLLAARVSSRARTRSMCRTSTTAST